MTLLKPVSASLNRTAHLLSTHTIMLAPPVISAEETIPGDTVSAAQVDSESAENVLKLSSKAVAWIQSHYVAARFRLLETMPGKVNTSQVDLPLAEVMKQLVEDITDIEPIVPYKKRDQFLEDYMLCVHFYLC